MTAVTTETVDRFSEEETVKKRRRNWKQASIYSPEAMTSRDRSSISSDSFPGDTAGYSAACS